MPAFDFPNPAQQGQEVTNPATGISYKYNGGVWQLLTTDLTDIATQVELDAESAARMSGDDDLQDQIEAIEIGEAVGLGSYYTKTEVNAQLDALAVQVDQNEEQLQAMSTALFNAQTKIEELQGLDIEDALSELSQARQDIIELKSKVSSLELTSFLILE